MATLNREWMKPPADTPEIMYPAWLSALYALAGVEEVVAQFEKDCDIRVEQARTPLDQMIDEATGRNEEVVRKFVAWFNENVWGRMD